ncbi:MAG: hypothetical protein ACAH06_05985, partial [Methylophilaceae bacterium]
DLGAVGALGGAQRLDVDGFGLQQIGLHQVFLSLPSARYTDKADGAPGTTRLAATLNPDRESACASGGAGRRPGTAAARWKFNANRVRRSGIR